MAWVFNQSYYLVLTDGPKSTWGISGYRNWPYQHRDILRQLK